VNLKTLFEDLQKMNVSSNDYTLKELFPSIYIGFDKTNKLVYIVRSNQNNCLPFVHGTGKIKVECNVKMNISSTNNSENASIHIIKFLSDNRKEQLIFLELCAAFFSESKSGFEEEYVLNTFQTIATFFTKKQEYSDDTLQGIFAELYTIYSFRNEFNLSLYWQSRDKMKFDFSLSDTDRIEVKSTRKEERRHRFLHEQLQAANLNILVFSYLLRLDDNGLSLRDLIYDCRSLMIPYPKQYLRLEKILHDVDEVRLSELKFDESHLLRNRKFFRAENIPRFLEATPDGVINAQYECILNGVKEEKEEVIIDEIRKILS